MSRAFGFIAVLLVVAAGLFIWSRQMKSISRAGVEGATADPRATIDLAGVRMDLLQFAKAERQHLASDGRYLPLSEMRSGGDTGLPGDARGPYRYTIDVAEDSFTATATYNGPLIEGVPKALHIGPDMAIVSE